MISELLCYDDPIPHLKSQKDKTFRIWGNFNAQRPSHFLLLSCPHLGTPSAVSLPENHWCITAALSLTVVWPHVKFQECWLWLWKQYVCLWFCASHRPKRPTLSGDELFKSSAALTSMRSWYQREKKIPLSKQVFFLTLYPLGLPSLNS